MPLEVNGFVGGPVRLRNDLVPFLTAPGPAGRSGFRMALGPVGTAEGPRPLVSRCTGRSESLFRSELHVHSNGVQPFLSASSLRSAPPLPSPSSPALVSLVQLLIRILAVDSES